MKFGSYPKPIPGSASVNHRKGWGWGGGGLQNGRKASEVLFLKKNGAGGGGGAGIVIDFCKGDTTSYGVVFTQELSCSHTEGVGGMGAKGQWLQVLPCLVLRGGGAKRFGHAIFPLCVPSP